MEKKEIVFAIVAKMNELFGIDGKTVTEDSALMEDLGLSSFDMLCFCRKLRKNSALNSLPTICGPCSPSAMWRTLSFTHYPEGDKEGTRWNFAGKSC